MANHPNAPKNEQPKTDARAMPKERAEYLAATYGYTPEQINVVRNAICVGATDAELEFFLATCKRVQLDPFARQIWFVKRRQKIEDSQGNESWVDVGRPETSIDGFRTIAERTGDYLGQRPIEWCGSDGKWSDVWLKDSPPSAARAAIFRRHFSEPLVAVALYREFCPVNTKTGNVPAMWRKMPANQLAKCAEALGFRRGFPRDLSGMVTDTEMEHVDVAASYSAPPKQIEQRKPDRGAEIVDAKPSEPDEREPVPATTPEPAAEQETAIDEPIDDLDREMQRCLAVIANAKTQDDLAEIGRMIVEAKKQRQKTSDDAHANSVINMLEPKLQVRWRELRKASK